MTQIVIFDIDGTLANVEHRRPFLAENPPDWLSFNESMTEDLPQGEIAWLLSLIFCSGASEVHLVTGREECYRELTEAWLRSHGIPYHSLKMRPTKDYRPDVEIKREILAQLRYEGYQILFTVDDRQSVVDMWREEGIMCLQCAKGDF